jgi:hypothetical protein
MDLASFQLLIGKLRTKRDEIKAYNKCEFKLLIGELRKKELHLKKKLKKSIPLSNSLYYL